MGKVSLQVDRDSQGQWIISEVPYGDTSKIVNIFTNEGVIGCIAKGAKSLKSNLRINTIKFTYGKFLIDIKKDKLSILKEASTINELINIKKDLMLISYLSYIVELTNQTIKQCDDYETLYSLFINIILKLNNKLNEFIEYIKIKNTNIDNRLMSNIIEYMNKNKFPYNYYLFKSIKEIKFSE